MANYFEQIRRPYNYSSNACHCQIVLAYKAFDDGIEQEHNHPYIERRTK